MESDEEQIQYLLSLNNDNPQFQVLKDYMLPWAVLVKSLPLVEKFIQAGSDINKSNTKGITPLNQSIHEGSIEIADRLIDLGADVNKANLDLNMYTPIYLAVVINNIPLIDKLIAAGADVNTYVGNLIERTPLSLAVKDGKVDIVKKLLDAGADIHKKDSHTRHDLEIHIASYALNSIPMLQTLLEVGLDINHDLGKGETLLSKALEKEDTTPLIFLLKQPGLHINELIVNMSEPPIDVFITRYIKDAILTDENKTILTLFMKYPGFNKQDLIDNAESGKYSPEVNEFILGKEQVQVQSPMWEGWTRSDISHLDDIFSQTIPANSLTKPYNVNDPMVKSGEIPHTQVESLFSFCPICLQYIKHEAKTCMYMSHDCKKNPEKFYHKKLYEKYAYFKSDMWGGPTNVKTVTWCTLCGRICKDHQHYPLASYTSPLPSPLPGGNPYETDCRLTNGGGGLPEKVWRYRRLREFANELNQLKGQITKQQAYEKLVEAMWDAPLQQRGLINLAQSLGKSNIRPNVTTYEWSPAKLQTNEKPVGCFGSTCKKPSVPNIAVGTINWRKTARNKALGRLGMINKKEWNLSANIFPKPMVQNAQPVTGLQPYTGELPIVHTSPPVGWSNYTMLDDDILIQFRHVKADGSVNAHDKPGEQISPDGLVGILKSRLGNPGSEEFGKCWQFYTGAQQQQLSDEQKTHVCTANLHPDEVDAALDMTDEDHKQTAKNYRTAYTNRFGLVTGGRRRRQTCRAGRKITRKSKHRKQTRRRKN